MSKIRLISFLGRFWILVCSLSLFSLYICWSSYYPHFISCVTNINEPIRLFMKHCPSDGDAYLSFSIFSWKKKITLFLHFRDYINLILFAGSNLWIWWDYTVSYSVWVFNVMGKLLGQLYTVKFGELKPKILQTTFNRRFCVIWHTFKPY